MKYSKDIGKLVIVEIGEKTVTVLLQPKNQEVRLKLGDTVSFSHDATVDVNASQTRETWRTLLDILGFKEAH